MIMQGDCIQIMRDILDDNTIDAIVTDPPYGLGFRGNGWDDLPPGEEWAAECLRVLKPGGHLLAFGGTRTWHRLAVAVEDAGLELIDSIAWLYGTGKPAAATRLKPAFEPIVVARKGKGCLQIDAARIGDEVRTFGGPEKPRNDSQSIGAFAGVNRKQVTVTGRWPANVALEERPNAAPWERFFYQAKAPKSERPVVDGVAHPTVKPLALMRWLVRLVTPPGGTVLDPFAGSGTTLEAAMIEGLASIGIERESAYLPLIEARLERSRPACKVHEIKRCTICLPAAS